MSKLTVGELRRITASLPDDAEVGLHFTDIPGDHEPGVVLVEAEVQMNLETKRAELSFGVRLFYLDDLEGDDEDSDAGDDGA